MDPETVHDLALEAFGDEEVAQAWFNARVRAQTDERRAALERG